MLYPLTINLFIHTIIPIKERAANAQIMGSYLADKYPSIEVPVIGFGSPVVGNAVFKTWVEETLTNLAVWRYVYKNDIVARFQVIHGVLAWVLRYEYCLSGHLINFDKNGSVKAYYRQGGDTIKQYEGAPRSWYCKFNIFSLSQTIPTGLKSWISNHCYLLYIPLPQIQRGSLIGKTI